MPSSTHACESGRALDSSRPNRPVARRSPPPSPRKAGAPLVAGDAHRRHRPVRSDRRRRTGLPDRGSLPAQRDRCAQRACATVSPAPLRTDDVGRDVFSRSLYGARLDLVIIALMTGISLSVGVLLGSIAGYTGGWLDTIVGRVCRTWSSRFRSWCS